MNKADKIILINYTPSKNTDRLIDKINFDNIHSPKDVDKELFQILIKQVGFKKIDKAIEELKANNTFAHKEYYSRMKKKYRDIINS